MIQPNPSRRTLVKFHSNMLRPAEIVTVGIVGDVGDVDRDVDVVVGVGVGVGDGDDVVVDTT